nr:MULTISPECIES: DTW domain-containing protein [unclassified Microbulbifer]
MVIDASWRKSKRILRLHPALQQLPRVSLEGDLHSNYQIRHSSLAQQSVDIRKHCGGHGETAVGRDFLGMLQSFAKMISSTGAYSGELRPSGHCLPSAMDRSVSGSCF